MSYLDLLPDDLMIALLESRCDDIEEEIRILEINIEYCEDVINDVNSDMDTFSDYYTADDDDDDELDAELENQYYQDDIALANIALNLHF